jgi:hypothetical protein
VYREDAFPFLAKKYHFDRNLFECAVLWSAACSVIVKENEILAVRRIIAAAHFCFSFRPMRCCCVRSLAYIYKFNMDGWTTKISLSCSVILHREMLYGNLTPHLCSQIAQNTTYGNHRGMQWPRVSFLLAGT